VHVLEWQHMSVISQIGHGMQCCACNLQQQLVFRLQQIKSAIIRPVSQLTITAKRWLGVIAANTTTTAYCIIYLHISSNKTAQLCKACYTTYTDIEAARLKRVAEEQQVCVIPSYAVK
jgi:hypothetical protein